MTIDDKIRAVQEAQKALDETESSTSNCAVYFDAESEYEAVCREHAPDFIAEIEVLRRALMRTDESTINTIHDAHSEVDRLKAELSASRRRLAQAESVIDVVEQNACLEMPREVVDAVEKYRAGGGESGGNSP